MRLQSVETYGLTQRGHRAERHGDQFLAATLRPSVHVHRTSLDVEDYVTVQDSRNAVVLAVATGLDPVDDDDGKASETTLEVLLGDLLRSQPHTRPREEFEEHLAGFPRAAQAQLQRSGKSDAPSCSLTIAYIVWPELWIASVGSGKGYVLSGDELRCFARRDRRAAVDEVLRPKEIPASHTIGGATEEVDVDLIRDDLRPGDVVMICTNTLVESVPEEEIGKLLRGSSSAQQGCRALVDTAAARGTKEDVTAVVADFRSASFENAPLGEEDAASRVRMEGPVKRGEIGVGDDVVRPGFEVE